MANTINTYNFAGDNYSGYAQSFVEYDSNLYVMAYFDVTIFYGDFVNAEQNGVVAPFLPQPMNLPPLPNVVFHAKVWKSQGLTNPPVPLTKDSTPALIYRQDIMDANNPANCLGTKFTFASRIIAGDCSGTTYCMVWDSQVVEVSYGASLIVIPAMSGITPPMEPCV